MTSEGPVEVVPDRLYALGGSVPIDGRVSWAPDTARGSQPVSCYLLRTNRVALLVDTGLTYHREAIVAQIRDLLPPGLSLRIFLTRSELDCVGNLTALSEAFAIDAIYTGGNTNPFDAFDSVTSLGSGRRVPIHRIAIGSRLDLGGSGQLEVLAPSLRILTTYWLYDPESRTLFTSDSFGHTMNAPGADQRILGSAEFDPASARAHMLAKFRWLVSADTRPLIEILEGIFADHEIDVIAPTHGLVLRGREAIEAHHRFVLSLLSDLAAGSERDRMKRSA
ncbi:MAG TPA: hypothetical protein VIA06_14330 [Candidatus Dormibacteraeota bacterium]|jgi:flavorubredoxin|nr:hypothetical protein [Candidatus Dormibacteraeota bacterium]